MVELDHKGLNVNITAAILSDEEMTDLGFTDHTGKNWYYTTQLTASISFNVTIPKDGSRFALDVLDEDFLQPYDYQRLLLGKPEHPFALKIKSKVEEELQYLSSKGVIHGWVKGMYV